ncbi:hypothetical protein AAW12_00555 [Sphingobacterium sp. Ag1]|nr:hypothetical protein AAW12_00555 [Sphingobacterium sp. Ag1]
MLVLGYSTLVLLNINNKRNILRNVNLTSNKMSKFAHNWLIFALWASKFNKDLGLIKSGELTMLP